MTYTILYLIVAFLCLWGIQFKSTGMNIPEIMNRMNRLRVIVAVILIFGHCTIPYDPRPLIILPFRKASTFCVGYFFILFGYGLAYSVATKPHYLRHFGKKIINLVWLTVFSSVLSTLIQNLALGTREPIQLINWYMPAITVLYLVFYVVYRLFPDSKRKRMIWLNLAVFILISAVCCYGNLVDRNYRNYFISELAFPFGVFIYEFSDFLSDFLKRKSSLLFILLAAVFFNGAALTVPELGLLDLIFHNLMLMPIALLVIWFLDKISIDNWVLKKGFRYTMFLYLFQFPILTILKNYYLNANRPFDIFYFLGCLSLTCILAFAVQRVYDFVGSIVHRLSSSES